MLEVLRTALPGRLPIVLAGLWLAACTATTSTSTTTTTTTSTSLPPTLCCEVEGPGCFDALAADATVTCRRLSGRLAPAGQRCDGASGRCAAARSTGMVCCQFARPSPPFPHETYCVEGNFPVGTCLGQGGAPFAGLACDPTTQRCSGL